MKKSIAGVLLAATLMSTLPLTSDAIAQASFSNSDSGLTEFMAARGYSDVRVTKRGFTISTMEACKNGEKFKVKVSILGQLKSSVKIGNCARSFGPQQIADLLKRDGYTDIDAQRRGNRFYATACRNNRQFGLTYNRRGQLIKNDRLGRCRNTVAMTPQRVAKELRSRGFNRIEFLDDQLPRYVAVACSGSDRLELQINRRAEIRTERRIGDCAPEINRNAIGPYLVNKGYERVDVIQKRRAPYIADACRNNDRLRLVVGRFGRIQKETRTGSCRARLDPTQMSQFLADKGYDRVRMLRSTPPFLVEACKSNNLMELTVGRFGRVRKEERVGRCATEITKEALEEKVIQEGYFAPTITRRNNGGWRVEACKGTDKVRLRYSAYGELRRENRTGSCQSANVYDVLTNLENRGAKDVEMYVEGCFQRNKYRWTFDRLGNRTDRIKLRGSC